MTREAASAGSFSCRPSQCWLRPVITLGLWVIGVPNAVLWGILAGLMRFVPFIGSIVAVFPIALAAAVDPGWSMAIATAGLFLVAEP